MRASAFRLIFSLLFLLLPLIAFAEESSTDDFQDYLDSFLQRECKRLHIPGAVAIVIQDGKIVFQKGYGFSNLEKRERMRPVRAVFRMGSISKLLTTTAILQLSEKGKLRLDDDVNNYLKKFHVVNPYPQPVRIVNLLTHTAGFDERNLGIATLNRSEVLPLGTFLRKHMPPLVRPPGSVISYSNLGYTLAGYVVEIVSGMPFQDYVQENILNPLKMDRSTFDLHKEPPSDLATGYVFENKKLRPVPFDYVNDLPADGLVSSGPDMARFLMASLQNGSNKGVQILKPESMSQFLARHFAHDPRLSGWCYGYYEEPRNGVRALMHDGMVYGYSSRVCLVPERNFAFFIAANGDVESGMIHSFTSNVLDYFFPPAQRIVVPKPPANFLQHAKPYEGYFRHTCYSTKTLEKIGLLMGLVPEVEVRANPDRTLSIGHRDYVELESMYFSQLNGRAFAVFRKNSAGLIDHLFLETDAFERIHWYETNAFQLLYARICLAIFAAALLVWFIKGIIPKLRFNLADHLSAIISAAHITIVGVLCYTIGTRSTFEMPYPVPMILKIALCLPILAILLTIVFLAVLFKRWKSISLFSRAFFSLFSLGALAFIWTLEYWNLIGFRY